jgi:hypothetical protein
MADISRSYDILDMLVGLQQSNTQPAPTSSPYFLGQDEDDLVKETETVSAASTGGPPYYPGAGLICGFWSCG